MSDDFKAILKESYKGSKKRKNIQRMAEGGQVLSSPEGIDEFLAQPDDSSDIALGTPTGNLEVKNMKQLGDQVIAHADKNLAHYNAQLKLAMGGDVPAQEYIANNSLGMATAGTLGRTGGIPVMEGPNPTLGSPAAQLAEARALAEASTHTYTPDAAFAHQKLQRALDAAARHNAVKRPVGFADGGEVQAPEGIDEFLAAGQEPQGDMPMGMPEGLDEFLAPEMQQQKYGTATQQAITGLEGAAEGIAGPLATLAETKLLGIKPEDIRGRQEANPMTHMGAEVAGFAGSALTGIGEARALTAAGELAAKLGTKDIGKLALQGATEWGLLQGGDEISKMIKEDPTASMQTALVDVGLAAALGGAGGAALGAVSPLWKAASETKVGQFVEDFKGAIHSKLNNPNPAEAVGEELSQLHKNITGVADDVYGASGLKAEEIGKVMPEFHEGMVQQADRIHTDLSKTVDSLTKANDPHASMMSEELMKYNKALTSEEPLEIFNTTQDLKQQLQEWGNYNKKMAPISEQRFRDTAKKLAYNLRESLEDTSVWGKAAERQASINKAFGEFLPSLKDFEKKFMTTVGEEKVIDPGKISTYMNQLGKPNAEIKQDVLRNFLDASDKYKNVLDKTHANLGLETPFEHSSLASARKTLDELTPGAKLANSLMKSFPEGAGNAVGAGIGAKAGHMVGGELGAIIGGMVGKEALGKPINTFIHSVLEPMLATKASGVGFKSALDTVSAVAKGHAMIEKAANEVFKMGTEQHEFKLPSEGSRAKLVKILDERRVNPEAALDSANNPMGHYMPAHSSAMAASTVAAVNFLNSVRPSNEPKLPLDSKIPLSPVQLAQFNNYLNLAQQPLLVLDKVKQGTVTPQDVMAIKSMYPQLYPQLVNKVTASMATHVSKGQPIPYKTRIGLSLFLDSPLDSTMTQMSIMNAQPKPQGQSPESAQAPQSMPKRTISALNKLPQTMNTPSQARAASQQKIR